MSIQNGPWTKESDSYGLKARSKGVGHQVIEITLNHGKKLKESIPSHNHLSWYQNKTRPKHQVTGEAMQFL